MGTHDGHRARMKARFVRCGLDNFDDHSVLELLLFYAVPRRDVNELAPGTCIMSSKLASKTASSVPKWSSSACASSLTSRRGTA